MNAVERLAWLSALASEPKATLALMKVMTKLAGHVNAKTGQCNPLKKTLAKETGLHIDTVKNTLGLAVQLDYIERDTRPRTRRKLVPAENANGGAETPVERFQRGSPDPC